MPIYEYRCRVCGKTVEVMQRVSDRPLRKCPRCSGRLEKIISRTSFLLKGGGWYSEGYQKGSKPAESKGGGKTETKKDKKSKTTKSTAAA